MYPINKTISSMTEEERCQYPIEEWVQGRALFNKKAFEAGPSYWGGRCYSSILDARIRAKVRLFEETIKNLTDSDIYLDVGAGNGIAIKEYRQLFPDGAEVIGIASSLPHKSAIQDVIEQDRSDEKFSFYLGDFKTFDTRSLEGKVTVITDVIGALRYGRDPAQVIRQAGALLKEGGLAFFCFTYSDGIKVPPEYENFRVLNRPKDSSHCLFRLWFHTIRGFDVLKKNRTNRTLEESKNDQEQIIKDIDEVTRKNFGQFVVVLRRNGDAVEADSLIIDPQADEDCQRTREGAMYWDSWCPAYRWEMSSYSKSMLKNPEDRKYIT